MVIKKSLTDLSLPCVAEKLHLMFIDFEQEIVFNDTECHRQLMISPFQKIHQVCQ
jgi:hypothetical protein